MRIIIRNLRCFTTSPRWTICILLVICSSQAHANNNLGRVVISKNFSDAHRLELTERLRSITGWSGLNFDRDGVLTWESETPNSGSEKARQLLTQAVGGSTAILLEDATKRSDVVFCRVVPGRWTTNPRPQLAAFVVLIDFDDFQHIMGDQLARESFNVGWGVLHELDHVVNNSADSDIPGRTGECEQHINAMRREMNLPERSEYFCTLVPFNSDANFTTRFVRLAFDKYDLPNRKRRYWLTWDASLVGGFEQQGQIALVR